MAARPPRRGCGGRLLRAGLGAVTAVLLLLLGEAVLALLDRARPEPRGYASDHVVRDSPHFERDAVLGWRMKPGVRFTWRTDGRDVDYHADARGRRVAAEGGTDPAAAARGRLLIGGDSFAFGVGVAHGESFGVAHARHLGLEPVIVAEPGYGVDQIVLALEAALEETPPGGPPPRVLLGLYFHDFERTFESFRAKEGFEKPRFALEGGRLVLRGAAADPPAWLRGLERKSRLFALLRRVERKIGMERGRGSWWRLNAALLERLRLACAARGADLTVVHVPPKLLWRFPTLAAWCADHGVRYVEPLDFAAPPPEAYYAEDSHLTAAGHAWLARALAAAR